MRDALHLLEAACILTGRKTVTEDEARAFLRDEHGADLAAEFRSEYLSSRGL